MPLNEVPVAADEQCSVRRLDGLVAVGDVAEHEVVRFSRNFRFG